MNDKPGNPVLYSMEKTRMIRRRRWSAVSVAAACLLSLWATAASADGLDLPTEPPCAETTTTFDADDVAAWPMTRLGDERVRISPVVTFGDEWELNHHRVVVDYEGDGELAVSVVHSRRRDLDETLATPHLYSRLREVASGETLKVSSVYRGERFAWVAFRATGDVRVRRITHTCWRGRDTLYGHVGRTFEFAGGTLRYRLLYPRDYDPDRSYPLVLSVHGSGGVGADNARSMERVILGRYLFTDYYDDERFACFSLVPQAPTIDHIPAGYAPRGERGKADPPYHPDYSVVNENAWYVQATMALIEKLKADDAVSIDPDRVYCTGFSLGGKAVWEFLKAGRTTFAAGMSGAGWAIGRAFSTPDEKLLARLAMEVERYKHVPVRIFAGSKDRMSRSSRPVDRVIREAGGDSEYVEFEGVSHVGSAGRIWGNPKYVTWVFEQDRSENPEPGPDPYPGGEYPDE